MALTKVDQTMVNDQVFGRRRLNINGDMRINQRGTKTSMTSGFGGPDRWTILTNSLGVYTLSQSSSSPNNFAKSYQVTTTTANGSPIAGAYAILSHKLEGNDLSSLKWGTADAEQVTVSFWVYTNKTGTYNLELYQLDNSSNPSANKQYTVSSSNTWEKKVVTFPAANNVEIPLDNTNALNLNFWLGAGTTYTSGSASDGNFHSTQANRAAGNVNIADSTDNSFRLTGVQLEIGDNATPFEYRPHNQELIECRRYFERKQAKQNSFLFIGQSFSTVGAYGTFDYQVEKRNDPSVSISAEGTSGDVWQWLTTAGGSPSGTGSTTAHTMTTWNARFQAASYTGLTNQAPSGFYSFGTAYVDIDAEL